MRYRGAALNLLLHFANNDDLDAELEEDVVTSLLGVVGYAAQTLELHPAWTPKVAKYLRSESVRLKGKILA